MELNSSQHISQRFDQELDEMRGRVVVMCDRVSKQLSQAVTAYMNRDEITADCVIQNDQEINELQMKVDEECSLIIARHQPTASDLRLVIGVTRIISDLERIGDQAKKIAKKAIAHHYSPALAQQHSAPLSELTTETERALMTAIDTFTSLEIENRDQIAAHDRKVDRAFSALMEAITSTLQDNQREIRSAIDMMWVAHSLERIGDHSRNICEAAVYIVRGKDIRHSEEQIEG
ncbi:MAG: phosphate signaling complex protein PhoU [Gammaproteobacteria bacterium]|nr:phosphate signaling complex protein PhoU [Gammaproteobacteria bacterium]